jgi:hypothetical protein
VLVVRGVQLANQLRRAVRVLVISDVGMGVQLANQLRREVRVIISDVIRGVQLANQLRLEVRVSSDVVSRDAPDIRPDYPAFFDIRYPTGYQIALPDIR